MIIVNFNFHVIIHTNGKMRMYLFLRFLETIFLFNFFLVDIVLVISIEY